MKKLSLPQQELQKRIKQILWDVWEPIGVNDGENEWDDEYDNYANHIFRLALEGKDVERIALSLSSVETDSMGMSPNKQHNMKTAEIIVQAKLDIIGE